MVLKDLIKDIDYELSTKAEIVNYNPNLENNISDEYDTIYLEIDENEKIKNQIKIPRRNYVNFQKPVESLPMFFDNATISEPIGSDPILLDLNGDGIKTVSVENGINLDHQSDGFAEKSAWVSNEDGILFIDKNNNEIIDNGSELFGENYVKSDGTNATTGFDALADLDSNNDNVIDSSDTQFSNLKIQKGDGTILTLEEAGISSINLDFQNVNQTDENGNIKIESGTFVKEDGSIVEMGSYNLQLDKFNSQVTEEIIISEEVSELPDVSGYGKVYSLHQAMMKDTTGALL